MGVDDQAESGYSGAPPEAVAGDAGLAAQLLDSVNEAIFTFSLPDSVITYWNAGAARLYGWTAEEAIGKRPPDLLASEHDGSRAAIVETVLTTGLWVGLIHQRRRDGARVVVEGRWVPQRDSAGGVVGIIEVNRDLTAERAAEVAKAEFLNLVAHALRTPFSIVNGYLSMLADGSLGPAPPGWAEAIETANQQLGSLGRIIEMVVSASALDERGGNPQIADVDVAAGVAAAIERVKSRHPGAEFVFDAPPGPLPARANLHYVDLIVGELLDNAAVHARSSWAISVVATVEDAGPAIYVKDFGSGIEPDRAARLFEAFGPAGSPGPRRSGLGLGLHVSRRLARAMGGDLDVTHTQPGEGSEFRLQLTPPSG